jgi:hypothetical protein
MPDFPTTFLTTPVPNTDAADFIASKPVVSRDIFNGMLPDLQARAFTVTGIEAANVLQAVRDRIADLPQGADWDAVKADIAGQISPYLDTEEVGRGESRAELLLRTHGFAAYDAASTAVMDRQQAAFPYWQYQTMEDERVRDTHAALDQLVLPADSPFWDRKREWGCRCIKVALSPEDVDQIQLDDADALPEEQRVLDGDRLHDIETSGRLVRALPGDNGMPREFNVTTTDGTGRWNQTTMDINVADLAKRYDPETWATFTAWAQSTDLGSGQGNVWDWLNGAGKPAVTVAPKPAATPAPKPPVIAAAAAAGKTDARSEEAKKTAVSAALKVTTKAAHVADITATIATIDKVHDDGTLPKITVDAAAGRGANGTFFAGQDRIGVSADSPWPRMTAAHEIGHLLDYQALGEAGAFASKSDPAFAEWRAAVDATAAIKAIDKGIVDGKPIYNAAYYLKPLEIWARSYAQYIATRSGDAEMLKQLNLIRDIPEIGTLIQWSDADFAPVATAIDKLFRAKGWIK